MLPGTSCVSQLIHNVQAGLSSVELVYATHQRWPLPQGLDIGGPTRKITSSPVLRISVLDSSFNPPTRAHLALATLRPPRPRTGLIGYDDPPSKATERDDDYDARLLLLSVRNADKALKNGDATFTQRVEMMMIRLCEVIDGSDGAYHNVAVAILDEPMFVGKARVLKAFLTNRITLLCSTSGQEPSTHPSPNDRSLNELPKPQLTFVVGTDTLERLFAPRYYGSEEAMYAALRDFFSPDAADCRVLCGSRVVPGANNAGPNAQDSGVRLSAKEFLDSGRISEVDIGSEEQTMSSSEARAKKRAGDRSWKNLLTEGVREYVEEQRLYVGEAE